MSAARPRESTAHQPAGGPASRIALLAACAAVFGFIEPPEATLGWNALFDIGHFFLFGFVTLALLDLTAFVNPRTAVSRRELMAVAVAFVLAVGSEVAQLFIATGVASIGDVLRDLAGVASALSLRRHRPNDSWPRSALPAVVGWVGVTAFVLVLIPSAAIIGVYCARDRAVPVVAGFDGSWWERWLVSTTNAALAEHETGNTDEVASDKPKATLLLGTGYSDLTVTEPFPDWSAFSTLDFTMVLAGTTPVTLGVSVNDRWYNGMDSDRFMRIDAVAPGRHRMVVPLDTVARALVGRRMDMTAIRRFRIFALGLTQPTALSLSRIQLK